MDGFKKRRNKDRTRSRSRSRSGSELDEQKDSLSHVKRRKVDKIHRSRSSDESGDHNLFKSLNIYILKAGIEKARLDIFKKQIKRFGGTVEESYNEKINHVSHIVVDDKMDIARLLRLLNLSQFPETHVVKSAWLSLCFKHKQLCDSGEFELKHTDDRQEIEDNNSDANRQHLDPVLSKTETNVISNCSKPDSSISKLPESQINLKTISKISSSSINSETNSCKKHVFQYQSDSDYEASDDDGKTLESSSTSLLTFSPNPSNSKAVNVSSWICAQSSKNPKPNANSHITSKFEEMVKAYESTNDRWRAFGYQKAIQALRRHPKEISSWEEAKALPGIGGRLADKIWEIAQSGELRKLKEFKSSEEVNILQMFNDVWGAGPHTAQLWYQQGFRTIKDLQERANLNHQQKVGVRLFDDLNERMPRKEAGEIEKIVREAAESLLPGVVAQACGSYRRGKATCGDVDVLVTHPDGRSHQGMFAKLLSKLKEIGFLTDDLVTAEDSGDQKKYLGVCKLPGDNAKHRRLDIIVVPYDEYGCALVYFTGSAHFNRSLRHMCKKQNMSLNEHALKVGVVRKGTEKIYGGTLIPTPTEEDVFKALKIPYRCPEERDH